MHFILGGVDKLNLEHPDITFYNRFGMTREEKRTLHTKSPENYHTASISHLAEKENKEMDLLEIATKASKLLDKLKDGGVIGHYTQDDKLNIQLYEVQLFYELSEGYAIKTMRNIEEYKPYTKAFFDNGYVQVFVLLHEHEESELKELMNNDS